MTQAHTFFRIESKGIHSSNSNNMATAGIDFYNLISNNLNVFKFYNWNKLNVMTYHHGRS